MKLSEKLSWALMTIREQLKFGLDEAQAVYARERRVKGVLLDAVKDVVELEEINEDLHRKLLEANLKTEKVMSDARLEMRLRDVKLTELENINKELYSPIQRFWSVEFEEMNVEQLLQYFKYEHLPAHLQDISKPFHDLAHKMVADLPANPERTAGLRKLLEAKDCAVRAKLTTSQT